jgi:hypothetical protein
MLEAAGASKVSFVFEHTIRLPTKVSQEMLDKQQDQYQPNGHINNVPQVPGQVVQVVIRTVRRQTCRRCCSRAALDPQRPGGMQLRSRRYQDISSYRVRYQ